MTNLISFVYIIFEKKSLLFPNLVVWTFFTYVRACRASNTTNTAQQGAIRPAQSSKASTCRPERDNASSRRSWRELAYRPAYIQLAAFSKRTKKSQSARQKYTTTPTKQLKLVWCSKDSPVFPISTKHGSIQNAGNTLFLVSRKHGISDDISKRIAASRFST